MPKLSRMCCLLVCLCLATGCSSLHLPYPSGNLVKWDENSENINNFMEFNANSSLAEELSFHPRKRRSGHKGRYKRGPGRYHRFYAVQALAAVTVIMLATRAAQRD